MPDLGLRHLYPRVNESWLRRFRFSLYLPLRSEDEHVFKTVRVPLADNRAEFDAQILALAKLLVDSLNEAALQKEVSQKVTSEKGIAKLERWLQEKKLTGWEPHTRFLRRLQALRGGTAHRKGENYAKAASAFQLDTQPLIETGRSIFQSAVKWINYLQAAACPPASPGEDPHTQKQEDGDN